MSHKIVFKNAKIVDGGEGQIFIADVGVNDGLISAVDTSCGLTGEKVIAAEGFCLSPGFIDFHSHSEWALVGKHRDEYQFPFLQQGVTSFFGGMCGFSPYPATDESWELIKRNNSSLHDGTIERYWSNIKEFAEYVEKKGIMLNAGLFVGHGTLRAIIKGNDPSPMTRDEIRTLRNMITKAVSQGAFGVSMGFMFIPGLFADDTEIRAVFEIVAETNTLVCIHAHTYNWKSSFPAYAGQKTPHNVLDIRYFCDMAKQTGAKLHLSHLLLKGRNTWHTYEDVLKEIDKANNDNANVTFGVIPYHWGNTIIQSLLPESFLDNFERNIQDPEKTKQLKEDITRTEQEIGRTANDLFLLSGNNNSELEPWLGKSFRDIGVETDNSDVETILWITKASAGKAVILTAAYSGEEGQYEELLNRFLIHEKAIIEIDAVVNVTGKTQPPAAFGACPKVIGRYAREKGIFSLSTAVHKMTGKSASRLGLNNRGFIREGMAADLVLFDADKIADNNTIADPTCPPTGIYQIWQSGRLKMENGKKAENSLTGKILKAC